MKVFLFGKNGMLGNTVFLYLSQFYDLIAFDKADFNPLLHSFHDLRFMLVEKNGFQKGDIVINCVGLIPQRKIENELDYYIVNSKFTQQLSLLVKSLQGYCIQISTNCVFETSDLPRDELVIPDAKDSYGLSKWLGEPPECTVIRTSILGEEKNTSFSLLNWALSQENTVNGFENHIWNGVTCLQLAKYLREIIEKQYFWKGIRHIFSPDTVSKKQLLELIFRVYKKDTKIIPVQTEKAVNKTLSSKYDFLLPIPCLYQQLTEQKLFFQIQKIQEGNVILQTNCRFCKASLKPWFQFEGMYPLAGGFLREGNLDKDCKIPLTISLCSECELLQCKEVIDSDILFKKGYFYYSSMIPFLREHFNNFAEFLHKEYSSTECQKLVLEIGCNDGVLLRKLEGSSFKTIGVDPSHTVQGLIDDGFTIYNDYFTEELANKIVEKHGQVDIFLSSNSFAHINNMKSILDGLQKILKPNGIAIVEVHNSLNILKNMNFEFIYHEHMTYYTKSSFCKIFERIGMSVEKIEDIDVHGGSMRVFIRNRKPVVSSLTFYVEDSKEFHTCLETFPKNLYLWKKQFLELYYSLKQQGKRIMGYGASGRANMFLRFLDIELDGIVDDAASKIGAYMPFTHIQIKDSDTIYTENPDSILLISWAYKDTILEKHKNFKGTFIIPLPSIEILSKSKE